jgi:hypothetical protein
MAAIVFYSIGVAEPNLSWIRNELRRNNPIALQCVRGSTQTSG